LGLPGNAGLPRLLRESQVHEKSFSGQDKSNS
jgi:hypothetical protein